MKTADTRYVFTWLGRVLRWLLTLLGASLLAFFLGQFSPTKPVENLTTTSDQLDSNYAQRKAEQHKVRQRLGLHLPLFYAAWKANFEPDTLYRIWDEDEKRSAQAWLFATRNWAAVEAYRRAVYGLQAAHSSFPISDSLRDESWVRTQQLLSLGDFGMQQKTLAEIAETYPSPEVQRCQRLWQQLVAAAQASHKPFPYPTLVWHGIENQYHHWLTGLLRGDFGTSYYNAQPVSQRLGSRLGWTMLLALCALLLAYASAVPMGVWMAARAHSPAERTLNALLFAADAVPSMWMATLLLLLFANPDMFDWFPATFSAAQQQGGFWQSFFRTLPTMVLPLLCYIYGSLAALSRMVRSRMLAELGQEYIRTAWAKGASQRRVLWLHAFRNASSPLITSLGSTLPVLVSGSLIVEQVFSIPGMAPEALAAAQSSDMPVLLAMVMLSAVMTVLGYAVSDFLGRRFIHA